jgi:hypothetical protein
VLELVVVQATLDIQAELENGQAPLTILVAVEVVLVVLVVMQETQEMDGQEMVVMEFNFLLLSEIQHLHLLQLLGQDQVIKYQVD